ncbi:hypothetical protein MTO96_019871 [Rhipicephalus appendiculatus]
MNLAQAPRGGSRARYGPERCHPERVAGAFCDTWLLLVVRSKARVPREEEPWEGPRHASPRPGVGGSLLPSGKARLLSVPPARTAAESGRPPLFPAVFFGCLQVFPPLGRSPDVARGRGGGGGGRRPARSQRSSDLPARQPTSPPVPFLNGPSHTGMGEPHGAPASEGRSHTGSLSHNTARARRVRRISSTSSSRLTSSWRVAVTTSRSSSVGSRDCMPCVRVVVGAAARMMSVFTGAVHATPCMEEETVSCDREETRLSLIQIFFGKTEIPESALF